MSLSRKFRETAVVRTKICPGPGFGSLMLTRRRLSRPVFSSSQLFICSPCCVFDYGSSLLCRGLADCPLRIVDHRYALHKQCHVLSRLLGIPSRRIRYCSVERFIPSWEAAPLGPATVQCVFSRIPRICWRSLSLSALRAFRGSVISASSLFC